MSSKYIVFTAEVQAPQIARLRCALTEATNAGDKEIHILISSPGGNVFEGLSIAAFMKALPATVSTYNINQTDSVANVIFAAGDKRYASKNASFLFHGVTMPINQDMIESQLLETYKNIQRLREAIATEFAKYTELPLEEVNTLMGASGGEILSATQALQKGIVHEIREPNVPQGVQIDSIGNL